MMEWGGIGIKETEDVLDCLRAGASARDLHALFGERVSGLIACALDELAKKHLPPDPEMVAWRKNRIGR